MVLIREVSPGASAEFDVPIEIALLMVFEAIDKDPGAVIQQGSVFAYELMANSGRYELHLEPSRHQQRLFERLARAIVGARRHHDEFTSGSQVADVVTRLFLETPDVTCSSSSLARLSTLGPDQLAKVTGRALTGTRMPIEAALKSL